MAGDGIPESVKQFIFKHIDSVELLDVLMLFRANSCRTWNAKEVSDELRTNPTSAANRLSVLHALGLLDEQDTSPPSYQYSPKTAANEELVNALAEVYRVRRHRVYELIFSPMKRARTFAEAFKVRSTDKDEDKNG